MQSLHEECWVTWIFRWRHSLKIIRPYPFSHLEYILRYTSGCKSPHPFSRSLSVLFTSLLITAHMAHRIISAPFVFVPPEPFLCLSPPLVGSLVWATGRLESKNIFYFSPLLSLAVWAWHISLAKPRMFISISWKHI